MQELSQFMSLVSDETIRVTQIQEEKKKRFEPRVSVSDSLSEFFTMITEAPRIPRKKGQPAGSDKHSDLYTDENPKGTIHGLKFATVDDAKASVRKIINSGKTHAHKIQAAVAMEQRAREMGKTAEAAVYRKYIDKMKKKTKEMNKEENEERVDVLKTFFERLDSFETALEKNDRQTFANKMSKYIPEQPTEMSELETIKRDFRIFKEMVTRQMQTIGGGGAVRLQDLDDVDTSSLGNGKFLVFNSSSGKLEFTDQVDGN